jgi:hypothetical protein
MKAFRSGLDRRVIAISLAVVMLGLASGLAVAVDIGSVVKLIGIGAAVQMFAGDINSFINKTLGERGAEAKGATKVVPILSLGAGGFVGAAQVVGVPDKVRTVKAVAQVELRVLDRVRGRLLVPIATQSTKSIKGVSGVGVSAILDFKL